MLRTKKDGSLACSQCGADLSRSHQFCPRCGASQFPSVSTGYCSERRPPTHLQEDAEHADGSPHGPGGPTAAEMAACYHDLDEEDNGSDRIAAKKAAMLIPGMEGNSPAFPAASAPLSVDLPANSSRSPPAQLPVQPLWPMNASATPPPPAYRANPTLGQRGHVVTFEDVITRSATPPPPPALPLRLPERQRHEDDELFADVDACGYPQPQPYRWRSELCDCCIYLTPNCCMALWLPCVSYSQINARMGLRSYAASLVLALGIWAAVIAGAAIWATVDCSYTTVVSGYSYDYSCHYKAVNYFGVALYWFALACYVFIVFWQRQAIRRRLQLPGDMSLDMLFSFFCSFCTLAQLATQVGTFRKGRCDFTAPPVARSAFSFGGPAASPYPQSLTPKETEFSDL